MNNELDFAGLLETLRHAEGEYLSINHQPAGGVFQSQVVPFGEDVPARAQALADGNNLWFGINPVRGGIAGRGTEADVTRLAAVWADLDIKPGGCADLDVTYEIIGDLAALIGQRPSAVTHSGHGVQPMWVIEDGHIGDGFAIGQAAALLRRWGRLVARVANDHGANVDSVYDLPRVLRIPDSTNYKSDPVPVTCEADTGGPLTISELDERLDEAGIHELDDGRGHSGGEVVSPVAGWAYARHDCIYAKTMVDGWKRDSPLGRHPWLISQAVRIAAAHRNGCLTAHMHQRAIAALETRFRELCARPGDARPVPRYEIQDALAEGVRKASMKTEAELAVELGNHMHLEQLAGGSEKKTLTSTSSQAGDRATDGAVTATEPIPQQPQVDTPKVWRATDLKAARQAQWIGKKWLPRAATTIVVGEEGIGKSLFWVLVAAAVTTGKPLPECGIPARDPAVVVIVVTEDDWQSTVLPRLIVAEADLDMIRVICSDEDGSGAPIFPRDIHLIDGMDEVPAAIIVDAWLDTVPAGLNVKDPQGARQALHPWKELSTRTQSAVILLTHTNRLATGNARDRYGATSELRKKARMTIYAQSDEDGRLVIGPEKANSVLTAAAAVFTIESVQHFEATDDDDGTVGRLSFVEHSERTARQHLADSHEAENGDDQQTRAAAVDWLEDYLLLEGPAAKSGEAKRAAAKAGFSERTLQRARAELKVVWGKSGFGEKRISTWSLPPKDDTASKSEDADEEKAA
jgi:hypothetical protein